MKRALLIGYLMTPVVFGIPYLLFSGQLSAALTLTIFGMLYLMVVGMVVDMVVYGD